MTIINFTIIGLDESRPPKIQTDPCIDLYFQLNEQAPSEWCILFQSITGRRRYPIKIDPEAGLFVETWVRKPIEIPATLETIKDIVKQTNSGYQTVLDAARAKAVVKEQAVAITEEQIALNRIVASLEFDKAPVAA